MIIPCNKNITKLKNNYYITAPITIYQTCPKYYENTCDLKSVVKKYIVVFKY